VKSQQTRWADSLVDCRDAVRVEKRDVLPGEKVRFAESGIVLRTPVLVYFSLLLPGATCLLFFLFRLACGLFPGCDCHRIDVSVICPWSLRVSIQAFHSLRSSFPDVGRTGIQSARVFSSKGSAITSYSSNLRSMLGIAAPIPWQFTSAVVGPARIQLWDSTLIGYTRFDLMRV